MLTPLRSDIKITPVILAGGQGLRLRPLTSPSRPKPFLRILSRYSFFQETLLRASFFENPVIICAQDYADKAAKEMAALNMRSDSIILEPESRGTAAAIAMAAFHLRGSGNLMLVMPSDHVITRRQRLVDAVLRAASFATQGIAMMGVKARSPSTRYGYLGPDGFFEKPDAQTAADLQKKGYFWNTGIFLCAPEIFLRELQRHCPEIYDFCALSYRKGRRRENYFYPGCNAFLKLPAISVDYAVMEHCKKFSIAELGCGWSDIGCWPDLLQLMILRLNNVFAGMRFPILRRGSYASIGSPNK